MRQGSFGADIKKIIDGITAVVQKVVRVTEPTLDESDQVSDLQRHDGHLTLKSLSECNNKLGQMGEDMMMMSRQGQQQQQQQQQGKVSKQKLATAAYDVARFTKELVTLLESPQ